MLFSAHKLPLPLLCVISAMSMFLYQVLRALSHAPALTLSLQLCLPLMVLAITYANRFTRLYHNIRDAFNLTGPASDLLGGLFVGVPSE